MVGPTVTLSQWVDILPTIHPARDEYAAIMAIRHEAENVMDAIGSAQIQAACDDLAAALDNHDKLQKVTQ